jgi:large subunit ribosomal protein L21
MAQYAIISLGGKQYVVHEGEKFLVDRIDADEGKTIQPDVLFVGGDGEGELGPSTTVTAKVVSHVRGPKIRIGKYRRRTGYRRHTGFRSSLTRIEITTIGGRKPATDAQPISEPKPKAERKAAPAPEEAREAGAQAQPARKGLPKRYEELTVAQISDGAKTWNRPMLEAALAYERENAQRKGAITALEHALAAKEK